MQHSVSNHYANPDDCTGKNISQNALQERSTLVLCLFDRFFVPVPRHDPIKLTFIALF
jgi:hypothetical protein